MAKICLVTTDLMGPLKHGGVGTSVAQLAMVLSQYGHDVEIMFAHPYDVELETFHWWQAFYWRKKIRLTFLPKSSVRIDQGHTYAALSYEVYLALKDRSYHAIVFPDMHGTGHYCLQAKHCGLAFMNTRLSVMFHGPGRWHLMNNEGLPSSFSELTTHFLEQQSALFADDLLFATDHAKNVARELGFLPEDKPSSVLLFPFVVPERYQASRGPCRRLVFFGRHEPRKGLEEFLDAVLSLRDFLLKNDVKVTLLGMPGFIKGMNSQEFIEKWMIKHRFFVDVITDKNQMEALEYLHAEKSLVVLASREETMGYTLIECLGSGLPVVHSDTPAFLDVREALGLERKAHFKTRDAASMAKAIRSGLMKPTYAVISQAVVKKNARAWGKSFEAPLKSPKKMKKNDALITISVCIPHFDRPQYLEQNLRTLKEQAKDIDEIIIYDDNSRTAEAKRYLDRLPTKLAGVPLKILRGKKNQGPSNARNQMVAAATSTHIVFLDDDNQHLPHAIATFKKALRSTKADVVVSSLLHYNEGSGSWTRRIWIPVGPDLGINYFCNLIGDANFCMRREAYLKTGGFDTELRGREDQEFLIRAIALGFKYALVPDALIYYRVHDSNHSAKENSESNLQMFRDKITKSLHHPELSPLWRMMVAWGYAVGAWASGGTQRDIVPRKRQDFFGQAAAELLSEQSMKRLFKNKAQKVGKAFYLSVPRSVAQRRKSTLVPVAQYHLAVHVPKACTIQEGAQGNEVSLKAGRNIIAVFTFKEGPVQLSCLEGSVDILVTDMKRT